MPDAEQWLQRGMSPRSRRTTVETYILAVLSRCPQVPDADRHYLSLFWDPGPPGRPAQRPLYFRATATAGWVLDKSAATVGAGPLNNQGQGATPPLWLLNPVSGEPVADETDGYRGVEIDVPYSRFVVEAEMQDRVAADVTTRRLRARGVELRRNWDGEVSEDFGPTEKIGAVTERWGQEFLAVMSDEREERK